MSHPKKIAIAVPAYSDPKFATAQMLWRLSCILGTVGIVIDEIEMHGCPDIALARNQILSAFLEGGAERLLFIDSDVFADVVHVMQLILSPHDYVGAAYPKKRIGGGMASLPLAGGRTIGKLVEADVLATGMLSLSRSCVSALSMGAEPFEKPDGGIAFAFTCAGVFDGQWVCEDKMLCRRWQAIGGVAWIDTSIECFHVGDHAFRGPNIPVGSEP